MMLPLHLRDAAGNLVADLSEMTLDPKSGKFLGAIHWRAAPEGLLEALRDVEHVAEHQSFAHLDGGNAGVAAFELRAVFADGVERRVQHLYASRENRVSFATKFNRDPFTDRIMQSVESAAPGISCVLHTVPALRSDVALRVLQEAMSFACQATHTGVIVIARQVIAEMPRDWLRENLIVAAKARLNFDDDWEYRRLLELTAQVCPDLIVRLIPLGQESTNPEVREVAEDYASGRYGHFV